MTTEAANPDVNNVTLGPDWLRSKPVFASSRYGQEELLNLWTCSSNCPQTILDIGDLNPTEALKPACLSTEVEETQEPYRVQITDRGRGRASERSRGGGRGGGTSIGVGRGGSVGGGARRQYEPTSRYYDSRSADSDNWRRRDPDPVPQPVTVEHPVSTDQPPSYPPFPSTSFSPTPIDNREANSWKRTEAQVTSPGLTDEPCSVPSAAPSGTFQSEAPSGTFQSDSPSRPEQVRRMEDFKSLEDSPETMLRNISKTLYDDPAGEKFNAHVVFSPFSDPKGSTVGVFGGSGSVESTGVDNPLVTSASSPVSPLNKPPHFNRDPQQVSFNRDNVSPGVQPGLVSPGITQPGPSQPSLLPQTQHIAPPSSQPFPSLSDIGKSLHSQMPEMMLIQGGPPPTTLQQPPHQQPPHQQPPHQQPPHPTLPQPTLPQPNLHSHQPYRADEPWFYMDPNGNNQGPFESVKMFGWFKEGYFGMDLEIRRAADTKFTKLETIISQCGRIPFQPEDKPPLNAAQQVPPTTQSAAPPPKPAPAWGANVSGSIWGNTDHSANFGINSKFRDDKVARAEEMRREIERAMEQQKIQDLETGKKRENQLAQQQIMEAKRAEDQKLKEEEFRRVREEEMKKSQLIQKEAERIRIEKEILEQERLRQAEQVRIELEEAEKARIALEQERIKLEKERQLVKLKEEELRQRDEAARRRREDEARVYEEKIASEERRAAQQAAAEAKAIAKAQEEANAAAIRECRREAEEQARRVAEARQAEQAVDAKRAAEEAAKKREQDNAWGSKKSPSAQENTNPWANIPQQNVTKAATRTKMPTTKGWGKPDTVSVPLSQIQQDEAQMKTPSSGGGVQQQKARRSIEQPVSRPSTWGPQPQSTKTRSLADIQREEQQRTSNQQDSNFALQNSWNPVAGMLEDDPVPKKQNKSPQKQNKPPQQKTQQPKAQNKKSKGQTPLLDMFADIPKDEFTEWCEGQVTSFKNTHIDVPTFISFLREVESPREVREYVVSYLGDTLATDKFIQEFVARRKTAKGATPFLSTQTIEVSSTPTSTQQQQQQAASKRGKRKKMQKVNAASLLGINCTASSDARNRGDIDSVAIL